MKSVIELDPTKHSVFISYSWDSEDHVQWVRRLVKRLSSENIQVVFDETHFKLGDPLPAMMDEAITKCEYVLFVCTPQYKKKADERYGGVVYEDTIITGEIFEEQNHRKYIPVFPETVNRLESTPRWAIGKLGVVFEAGKYEESIRKIVDTIIPKKDREVLPDFYHLSEGLQELLLKNIERMIPIDEAYGSNVNEISYLLSKIDRERVCENIKVKLDKTEKRFHDLLMEIIDEAIPD